ncbi:MAG: hypothetical protein ABIQ18_06335 [Umezawaea sp.]
MTSALSEAATKVLASRERINHEFSPITDDRAGTLTRRVGGELESGTIGLHVPGGTSIDFVDASVYASDKAFMVIVPLSHPALVAPSALVVAFDRDGIRRSYAESQFSPLSTESGKVLVWSDGVQVASKIAYNDGTTTELDEQHAITSFEVLQESWFDRFLDCMSRNGVSSWILSAIAVACGAVCIATAGLGCTGCIAAVAGSLGGIIGLCLAESA